MAVKGKRLITFSRNKLLGDRKGHRLDEMDSGEVFEDVWGDEDGVDFNVSPGSECSRGSGGDDVEVDSPGDISTDQATGGSSSEGDVSDSSEAVDEEEKDSNDGSDMDGAMEGHGDVGLGPSRKHRHVRGREARQDNPHRKRDHPHWRRGPTHRSRDPPPPPPPPEGETPC